MTKLPSIPDGTVCQALAFTHTFLPNSGYRLLDGPIVLPKQAYQELTKVLKILGVSKFLAVGSRI